MVLGKDMWKNRISFDLCEKEIAKEKLIETYKDLPENLYDAFVSTVGRYPDKVAMVDDSGNQVTFRQLKEKTDSFSFYLKHICGLAKGSHVGLMMMNSVEFCVSFLSIVKLGAVCISLPTKYKEPEIHSILDKADVDFIICSEPYKNWFTAYQEKGIHVLIGESDSCDYGLSAYSCPDEAAESADSLPDDPVLLVFTSGTTSQSKGVLLRNYNIMHAIVSYQLILDINEDDVSVIPIPMYLITGMIAVMGLFLYTGGTVYLHKKFNAKRVLQCVKDNSVTFLHASPTVFSMLISELPGFPELPSLKKFACGSSNMPKEKIMELHEFLPNAAFHTVYGLTETTSPATIFPIGAADSPYIGSSGLPIPGLEFKIVREDKTEAEVNEIGTVCVRGTNILDSYYKMDTPLLQNGWLDTGDLGYFNKAGYLFIADRKKDMINRGGEKITCFDVENELYLINGVNDAAVVGIPDSIYGEVPVAVITLKPGFEITNEQIIKILKTRLAGYMIPTQILILDRLPETRNGKINKRYIRTLFKSN